MTSIIRFENLDGLTYPVFICAQCSEPIQGTPGLVQWENYDNPTFTAYTKVHISHAPGNGTVTMAAIPGPAGGI